MSTPIDPTNDVQNSSAGIDKLRWENQVEASKQHNQLTQEDFFALLTKQLAMQDPFKPVQNEEMIGQMTNFASVDGINSLKAEIVNLNTVMTSSQALQASSLVGQKVLLRSTRTYVEQGEYGMGTVDIPVNGRLRQIQVQDSAGQLIANIPMAQGVDGNMEFLWDGTNDKGESMPSGMYQFTAVAEINGRTEQLEIATYGHVSSVSLGNAEMGTMLNIKGGNSVDLDDVLAVAEPDSV